MGVNDNVSGWMFAGKAIFALSGTACRGIEKKMFSGSPQQHLLKTANCETE